MDTVVKHIGCFQYFILRNSVPKRHKFLRIFVFLLNASLGVKCQFKWEETHLRWPCEDHPPTPPSAISYNFCVLTDCYFWNVSSLSSWVTFCLSFIQPLKSNHIFCICLLNFLLLIVWSWFIWFPMCVLRTEN